MNHEQYFQDLYHAYMDYQQRHPFSGSPRELYAPVDYIMQLGGKRLRPILVLMAYHLYRDDYESALPIAYAVEIFHNFTLVHDDIMDEAVLRRGKTTVHRKWDSKTAILSGDVMLIYAYDYLTRFGDDTRLPAMVRTFNRLAREVCEGQQYDMNFEGQETVTIPDYLRMIELKTSVLIAGALELGAIAAGAREADVEELRAFGIKVGVAFQIQDDILDTFGDPEKVGKTKGGDIIQNKKTYLILKAFERGTPAQREELVQLMRTTPVDPADKVIRVTELLAELDIPKTARADQDQLCAEAFGHLDAVDLPERRKAHLRDTAQRLFVRSE